MLERVQFLQRVLKDDSRSAYKKVLPEVLGELSNRETSKRVLKESFEESSKSYFLKAIVEQSC